MNFTTFLAHEHIYQITFLNLSCKLVIAKKISTLPTMWFRHKFLRRSKHNMLIIPRKTVSILSAIMIIKYYDHIAMAYPKEDDRHPY
jgi:hypothetical protein